MADTSSDFGTIIGADARFKGDLSFDSSAKVLGQIEGSIASKGIVHVAGGSVCKASVNAKEVAVEGHIEGNVNASDRVELKPKGRITGDIVATRMSMADGASIVGHCRIGVDGRGEPSGKAAGSTSTEIKPAQAAVSGRARSAT
jgi:cytoskeletal protein CcmA (bactofilin family)